MATRRCTVYLEQGDEVLFEHEQEGPEDDKQAAEFAAQICFLAGPPKGYVVGEPVTARVEWVDHP